MPVNTNWWNRARYTVWAPVYDPLARWFGRPRARAIALLAPQPGEKVLIVGAGTGIDLEHLPRAVLPGVTAIDLTPGMVRRLRRRAGRLAPDGAIDVREMDGQNLQFPDAWFDCVILHLIVAIIPDPVRCVREAARVLRPGGRAVIFDKFAPEGRPVARWRRALNLFANVLATDVTRQLGPILAGSGLEIVHEEAAGGAGFFRIAVLRKAGPAAGQG